MRMRDPRDGEIGKRVRTLRLQRDMSQTELGNSLQVTFQQVQKYENGANRISAGRLQRIAEVLEVPVTFFYNGFAEDSEHDGTPKIEFESLQSTDAVRMLKAYSRIKPRGTRLQLLKLTEALAEA